ncbi:hypothetical protein TrCOL_g13531 [Triparma columacea]|uniref:SAP domain-containing protein n=1 Tax=Triparma columacea TaxID=722753 RepID=A0A9W7GFG9_9STRA|nr:hypothetical protein TrCOL_g13531 [Triparma columacea]
MDDGKLVTEGEEGTGFWDLKGWKNNGKRWKGIKEALNVGTIIREGGEFKGGRVGDGWAERWGVEGVERTEWKVNDGNVQEVKRICKVKGRVEGMEKGWVDRGGYLEDVIKGGVEMYNAGNILDLRNVGTKEGGEIVLASTTEMGVGIMDEVGRWGVVGGADDGILSVDGNEEWIVGGGRKRTLTFWGYEKRVGGSGVSGFNVLRREDVEGHTETVTSVKISSRRNPPYAVSTGVDKTLKLWVRDNKAGTWGCKDTVRVGDKTPNVVAVGGGDKYVATGCMGKTCRIWKVGGDRLIEHMTLKGHKRGVTDVAFSESDRVVATASGDRTVKVWELRTGRCARTLQGHGQGVTKVGWMQGGTRIVSADSGGILKVWSVRSGVCETEVEGDREKVWSLTGTAGGWWTGGSEIKVWRDVTEQVEGEKKRAQDEVILKEQEMDNLVRGEKWGEAIRMGIEMDKPLMVLRVMEKVLKEDGMGGGIVRGIAKSWGSEEVKKIMGYCRVWNTRARNAGVAQKICRVCVEEVGVRKLVDWGVDEEIAGMVGYTERHYKRLDELVERSYVVDFVLESMGVMEEGDVVEEEEVGALGITVSGKEEGDEMVVGEDSESEGESVVGMEDSDEEDGEDLVGMEESDGDDIVESDKEEEEEEEESSSEDSVDLTMLKVKELKELLKTKGLNTTGKKAELVERLQQAQ